MQPIIYTPAGRAREYAKYAVNIRNGCDHGCKYCYAAGILHKTRADFQTVIPTKDLLQRLEKNLEKVGKLDEPIHFCFTCDPYSPDERRDRFMTEAIRMVHESGNCLRILTKQPSLAKRDFHLLSQSDEFGVTLTFSEYHDSLIWEPLADSPAQRIALLKSAHARGIWTWVSLEPVIYPEQTLDLIQQSYQYVDSFRVGMLNHTGSIDPRWRQMLPEVNWATFAEEVFSLLTSTSKPFYVKSDLREYLSEETVEKLLYGWGNL